MVQPIVFQFLNKPEYYSELIGRLAGLQRGDRFITANMVTWPHHPEVAAVIEAMTAAAHRGANVALICDASNFMLDEQDRLGPLLFHHQLPRRVMGGAFQALRDAIEELERAGARTVVLNRPARLFSSPVSGRCHIKFTVTGDRFYIGGCNLEGYDRLDMMVAANHPGIAAWLDGLGERLLDSGRSLQAIGSHDVTYEAGPDTTLLLDAGVPGRSLILEQALELIDSAREHVFITCQFFPGTVTAAHLRAAHQRGAKVDIVYNRAGLRPPLRALAHSLAELPDRLISPSSFFQHSYPGPDYLHAKLIATEQGAIVGSHNFVSQGVELGTAELAMQVRDPKFAHQAVQSVCSQLSEMQIAII